MCHKDAHTRRGKQECPFKTEGKVIIFEHVIQRSNGIGSKSAGTIVSGKHKKPTVSFMPKRAATLIPRTADQHPK
jgi:hypothetical protein